MAVHNPAGLYSENQGVFNSTPFTQFAIQQEAKRVARDEALDKYYQGLPKSINSAGLRNQDTGGFIDKINGIRDFYAKNRDAIKNPRLDRGKAQAEYQARNTDASMYVNQSKAEELKKAPLVKILANPDMRDRVMDSDLQRLHQHDLPLNDPNRKSFDFGTIDFNPKELTPQETESYQKSLTAGFQPSEKVVNSIPNSKDLTITNTYQKQWSPEQLKATADKDISNVTADRRLEYNAEQTWKRVSQNPDQFKQYNDIYKSIYGKDIQHPAELHAAMQVGGILGSSTRQEIKPDENARDRRNFDQQKQMAGINNKYAEGRIRMAANLKAGQGKQEDLLSADTVLSEVSSLINKGDANNEPILDYTHPMSTLFGKKTASDKFEITDPTLVKQFDDIFKTFDDKGVLHKASADLVRYNKKNDEFELTYKYQDGGEETKKIDGRTYLAFKVKQKFPNKDIGEINNIIEKVYKKKGSLYNISQDYKDVEQQPEQPASVTPKSKGTKKINGW